MPISVDDFLESLDLPTEHPYIGKQPEAGNDEVATERSENRAPSASSKTSFDFYKQDKRPDCSSPSKENGHLASADWTEIACHPDSSPHVVNSAPNFITRAADFVHGNISLLTSIFHLITLLLAPLVLMTCLMKLILPPQCHKPSEFEITKRSMSQRITRLNLNNPANVELRGHEVRRSITSSIGCYSLVLASDWLVCFVGISFSAIVMTDAMFVYEFSRNYLVTLHFLFIALSMKRVGWKLALCTALPISPIALHSLMYHDLDLPTIKPGLYFDNNNPYISEIVKQWPVEKRTYDDGRGTPWMITGDARSFWPYIFHRNLRPKYTRRWLPIPDEREAVIIDIAFPESMIIENDKTIYLVLHGINGGSSGPCVGEFVARQVSEGNIVAVMVTRGLMDSPIIGDNILHFARTSDVSAAAKALKLAAKRANLDGALGNTPLLAGVGYSMGAIILANYVARSGHKCDLDVAVGFSGGLDLTQQSNFARSKTLFSPIVMLFTRAVLFRKFSRQINGRLSHDQIRQVKRAQSFGDLDATFFAPYNNYENSYDYQSAMSAMGDFVGFDRGRQEEGRISNVSIPLCMVLALDDPVIYWGTYHDPSKVALTGSGNTMLLVTKTGGHVGWPLGMNPSIEGWGWMSEVASSLVVAVDKANKS